MLGVICAMDIERAGLIALMSDERRINLLGYEFTVGKVRGKEIAVVLSGIGKVNAAAVTALLISRFGVSEVINLGVCGGKERGAMIVADSVVQYDFDTTAFGDELGQFDGFDSPYIKTSDISERIKCDLRGVIASGDKFIVSEAQVKFLTDKFNAIGFDMESGAVAQICSKSNVRFAVVRVVSDGGDASEYEKFKLVAAQKGIDAVVDYIAE